MSKSRAFVTLAGLVALAATTVAIAGDATEGVGSDVRTKQRNVNLEFVGQVQNSAPGVTPATSIQYGYLSRLNRVPVFKAGPPSESTALFTFYTDTTTLSVINNGPLRVINREGTLTIYSDPAANGNFVNPDSFRDGTPILVAALRQQVIIDTTAGTFTTHNVNTIVSTRPFQGPSGMVTLGKPGHQFRTILVGRVNTPGPPAAHIAGYAYSVPKHAASR
jgi:hypothetical protein